MKLFLQELARKKCKIIFLQDVIKILQENYVSYNFFLQVLARSVHDFSILARKASFLVQVLQDLLQDLASLARKILTRLAYFLQDGFY